MSLSKACDELLESGVLYHEYGIPKLWHRSVSQANRHSSERAYYDLNRELLTAVDKLVYMNQRAALKQLSKQEIEERFLQVFDHEDFRALSPTEYERFLRSMAHFKTNDLTAKFVTMALPTLRSIYQDNTSLADAELSILNNLKKLYSHYNEHPANIRRLLREYSTHDALITEEAKHLHAIFCFLKDKLKPGLFELQRLNEEYSALESSYKASLEVDASDETGTVLKKLRNSSKVLSQRVLSISAFCDLLPNMCLCHASNWFSDHSLRVIIEESQEIAEKVQAIPVLRGLTTLEDFLSLDFESFSQLTGSSQLST